MDMHAKNKEPAWHRRLRRERSHARVICRLAAACRALRNHHGSTCPKRHLLCCPVLRSVLPIPILEKSLCLLPFWVKAVQVCSGMCSHVVDLAGELDFATTESPTLKGDWRTLPASGRQRIFRNFDNNARIVTNTLYEQVESVLIPSLTAIADELPCNSAVWDDGTFEAVRLMFRAKQEAAFSAVSTLDPAGVMGVVEFCSMTFDREALLLAIRYDARRRGSIQASMASEGGLLPYCP
eukprot:TRINITY_DN33400_c0_g1_i2.p1 TRINITY_DN33400_c0_g1~~TRINITY_DN33400_c0_g1_i2.p1  ORF type:complete len:256 (-),score=11.00 TRINITY_DN33400_c0_g1_i2:182-895(-)